MRLLNADIDPLPCLCSSLSTLVSHLTSSFLYKSASTPGTDETSPQDHTATLTLLHSKLDEMLNLSRQVREIVGWKSGPSGGGSAMASNREAPQSDEIQQQQSTSASATATAALNPNAKPFQPTTASSAKRQRSRQTMTTTGTDLEEGESLKKQKVSSDDADADEDDEEGSIPVPAQGVGTRARAPPNTAPRGARGRARGARGGRGS